MREWDAALCRLVSSQRLIEEKAMRPWSAAAILVVALLSAPVTVPAYARDHGAGHSDRISNLRERLNNGGFDRLKNSRLRERFDRGDLNRLRSGFRNRHDHGGYGSSLPPGFSHGNKRGWGGGDVPPGWSKGKKHGHKHHH
jgi:hypothetical protein